MRALLIFCVILYFTPSNAIFDIKMKTHRIELKYYNKTILERFSIKNQRYNTTYLILNIDLCLKKPVTEAAKIKFTAYAILNNVKHHTGVEFEVGFCKAIKANTYGVRDGMLGSLFSSCPLKIGCYKGFIHSDKFKPPPGIPAGSYMIETSVIFERNSIAYTTQTYLDMVSVIN